MYNLFVNDLTVLDCAIWDYQRGPIGMSWSVDVEFLGGLDDDGVVFDFSHAKKVAKSVIDNLADHKLITPYNLVNFDMTENNIEYDFISMEDPYPIMYRAPREAFCILKNCSKTGLIAYLEYKILDKIDKDNVYEVRVTLKDESDINNVYSYTHGLKTHYGNCQRLLHGHQSSVRVFVNSKRREDIEKDICDYFYDKHIVYKQNLISDKQEKSIDEFHNRIGIKYKSSQGEFSLKIPKSKVIVFENYETTVECISEYIANWISKNYKDTNSKTIEVHAYEGIGKGSKYILNPRVQKNIDKKLLNG